MFILIVTLPTVIHKFGSYLHSGVRLGVFIFPVDGEIKMLLLRLTLR